MNNLEKTYDVIRDYVRRKTTWLPPMSVNNMHKDMKSATERLFVIEKVEGEDCMIMTYLSPKQDPYTKKIDNAPCTAICRIRDQKLMYKEPVSE